MFNQDRGATTTYRMLARGRGCAWVRTYHAAQRSHGAHPNVHRNLDRAPLLRPSRSTANASRGRL